MYISRDAITFTDEEICTIYRGLTDSLDDYLLLLEDAVNEDMVNNINGYIDDLRCVLNKIDNNGEFYPF